MQLCFLFPQGNNPLPNPHGDPMCSQPIMAIQQTVADLLFSRGGYVKKLIEDCNNSDETTKLLKVGDEGNISL